MAFRVLASSRFALVSFYLLLSLVSLVQVSYLDVQVKVSH